MAFVRLLVRLMRDKNVGRYIVPIVPDEARTFGMETLFRQVGIKYLVTSTPVLDGRSFGTNMMEAAMIAAAGKGRKLTHEELSQMLDRLGFQPQLQELN